MAARQRPDTGRNHTSYSIPAWRSAIVAPTMFVVTGAVPTPPPATRFHHGQSSQRALHHPNPLGRTNLWVARSSSVTATGVLPFIKWGGLTTIVGATTPPLPS